MKLVHRITPLCLIGSLAFLADPSSAWSLGSSGHQKKAFQKAVAGASASLVLGTAVAANAAVGSLNADVNFSGKYSDPNHPNCRREIVIDNKVKAKTTLKGTDGNPGCPPDGSGAEWQLPGKVKADTIVVDFTKKGGPPNLVGKWDKSDNAPGIRWPDGNKWTLVGSKD